MCKEIVSQRKAAEIFGVSEGAIRIWIKSGKLNKSVSKHENGYFVGIDIEAAKIEIENSKVPSSFCKRCQAPLAKKRKVYCKECSRRYEDVACLNCKSIFTQKTESQKFCSVKCAVAMRPVKPRQERINICTTCGEQFTARSLNNKYCSPYCKGVKIHRHAKACILCGDTFTGTAAQVYCNKECARLVKNKQRTDVGKITLTALWRRDSFTCIYCGMSPIEDGVKLSSDHIVSLDKGGEHTIDNLVTACKSCNSSKKNKELSVDITMRITDVVAKRNTLLSQAERLSLQSVLKIVRADYVYKRGRWAE